jgi:Mitochondrial carrier protein
VSGRPRLQLSYPLRERPELAYWALSRRRFQSIPFRAPIQPLKMSSSSDISIGLRLFLAGASNVIAASFSHPIDTIKVAFQIKGEGVGGVKPTFMTVTKDLVSEHGIVRGLYSGLFPSLLREATYSSMRLGLYEPAKGFVGADRADAPFHLRLAAGLLSGSTAAICTNWADILKVRAQAQKNRSSLQGSEITRTWRTAKSIVQNEGGILALWQGWAPNVQRAALLTAFQVGTYDQTKATIKAQGWLKEGLALHSAASIVAGFVTAVVTSPVDLAKTRLMNQRQRLMETHQQQQLQQGGSKSAFSPSSSVIAEASKSMGSAMKAVPAAGAHSVAPIAQPLPGELFYTSTLDCLTKTFKAEGFRGLYKGFSQQWLRLAPHTIITFVAYEALRDLMGVKPM